MRFLKVFAFVFVLLFSVGVMAATDLTVDPSTLKETYHPTDPSQYSLKQNVVGGVGGAAAALATYGTIALAGGPVGLAVAAAALLALGTISAINWFWKEEVIFTKIIRSFSSIDNGCWFCGIFEKLFNAVNTFAAAISDNMAGAFTKLLWIFLLFYIAFKVLKAVISFGEINPKEFLTDLFMPLLKTAMAIIVLYNMSFFYEQVVSPLAELSIGFSINMQETGNNNISELSQVQHVMRTGGNTSIQNVCEISGTPTMTSTEGLSPAVNSAIQCFLRTISSQLITLMAVGASFIAASWKVGESIFPEWSMLFIGIFMFLGCFFIFLSFPFKLLDGLFKLMFVCGLMPLWVILWVLPATREYSGKAFKMFLDVLITFICLSVIMMMVIIILLNALPSDFSEVIQLLAEGDDKEALAKIDWSTGNFFMFLAMMFLALELLKQTDSFVSQFAGGSLGIGAGLEGWGRAGAQLVGTKVAKPIATNVAKGTGKAIGTGLEKGWEGAKAAAKKTPYAAGYALGAAKRGLRDLNSGPKLSATQAMTPTGVLPTNPTARSGGVNLLNVKKTSPVKESLPDGKTKETEKTTFTDKDGKKKMEHTHETVRDSSNKEVSTSVKREKFDERGNSTGSTTVETDKVSGKKTLTEKDAKGKEVRTIIKTPDGTTTTQNNYVYDVDGKLSAFEKKIEEKIAGKMTVTKHVKVDAKTGTETDILPHP